MIALQKKETMQRNPEASVRCFEGKAVSEDMQDNRSSMEEFPEKNETSAPKGGMIVEGEDTISSKSFSPPNAGYQRPMHPQNFFIWSSCQPDFQKLHQNQWNVLESHFYSTNFGYPFPVDYPFHYVPFEMFSYPHGIQFQEFQYFVVIDFEATCDKEKNLYPQEIIEFPSVLVNSVTGQIEASFQIYVRPTLHQNLSDFCKELTGIKQIQVDRGIPLSEALFVHDKWLEDKGIKHTNFAVVTWSNWDCQVMLESECHLKNIRKPPYFNRWINLKVPFHEVFGGVRCNLKEAVQLAGLVWEGRAHCGLDDARNTARLLSLLMHQGFKFSITNSLIQSPDRSIIRQQSPDRPSGPTDTLKFKQQVVPFFQYYPTYAYPDKEQHIHCYCGVKSSKRMVRKPGPKHGSFFFGCGNWTSTRGALCPYFEWVSP